MVLAGKLGYGGPALLSTFASSGVVYLDYVSEQDKHALLTHALAFVFPSLYEGFGLPLLEAMATQLPVIASDIPTNREIMEDHALYFKPTSEMELVGAMERLIKNPDLIQAMIQNYDERLAAYTWEGTAANTWQLLDAIHSGHCLNRAKSDSI
ncbi:glycosyltransferase [Candidatus Peregrinibacteria bacterium]|nr:MAG: glycosyltransferase [Candidatus Peregrinibacteria bacterium]